jgi:radical SAM superfamily enzyme YgiQ (UPF0313 family)
MKIFFISPNRLRLVVPPLPIGLASVVAAVKDEHEVRVLDFMFAEDPLGEVRRVAAEFAPEIIALSIRNIDNQDSRNPESFIGDAKELVDLLRKLSAAPIVVGGAGFSIIPKEFMEYLGADFGITGEGEGAFREFLAAFKGSRDWQAVSGLVWRQGEEWRLNPVQRVADLKSLAPPALEYFTPELYEEAVGSAQLPGMIPVQTRRGCPMKCIYCTTPLLEGRRFRSWEPAQIAARLAAWHERWGVTRFYFVDNLFNCPPDYAKRLCRAIIDLKLPLKWGALINPSAPDRELFRLMLEAGGGFMQVGNESGSELVLTQLGKGFGRRQVEETFRLMEEEGIAYSCFLLLGGPGETPETVQESVALLEQYHPQLVNLTVGVRIYPGLALHRLALEEGVVAPGDNLLLPRFYLAPAIEGWIWEYLEGVMARHPNWIF